MNTKTKAKSVSGAAMAEKQNGGKRKKLVLDQLMRQACILFAEKGYGGTTLSEIADSVGLTRAAVYYYFKNKESLLEAIVTDLTAHPLQEIATWRKTAPKSATERLRSFIAMRVMSVLTRQTQIRMISVTEAALPDDLLARHSKAKRKILNEYRSILRDGIQSGEFRQVDDRITALGLVGMVNWTTYWHDKERKPDAREIAEHLADMAVSSVAIEQSRQDSFRDTASALKTLREDVEQLSALIEANPDT